MAKGADKHIPVSSICWFQISHLKSQPKNECIIPTRMRDHTLNAALPVLSLHQDHVFRIDPAKVEDGKGKSPYDPRHNAASVLVGELTDSSQT